VLEKLDRFLSRRWVQRLAAIASVYAVASFVVGAILTVAGLVIPAFRHASVLGIVGVALMIFGVLIFVVGWADVRRLPRNAASGTLRKLREGRQQGPGVATEIVTSESIERNLNAFLPEAARLLASDATQAQVADWAGRVGLSIRAWGPEGEEDLFMVEGNGLDPKEELRAKVGRIHLQILPKVRAGQWMQGRPDVPRQVARHAGPGESLSAWLDLRATEMRGLKRRLDEVLALSPFKPDKALAVQQHFFEINGEVDRKLHTDAPEWVDYFNENPTGFPMELTFLQPEQFREHLVVVIDSTIDQIAHIRAHLAGALQTNGVLTAAQLCLTEIEVNRDRMASAVDEGRYWGWRFGTEWLRDSGDALLTANVYRAMSDAHNALRRWNDRVGGADDPTPEHFGAGISPERLVELRKDLGIVQSAATALGALIAQFSGSAG
jgi:hypothetical protein